MLANYSGYQISVPLNAACPTLGWAKLLKADINYVLLRKDPRRQSFHSEISQGFHDNGIVNVFRGGDHREYRAMNVECDVVLCLNRVCHPDWSFSRVRAKHEKIRGNRAVVSQVKSDVLCQGCVVTATDNW